MERSEAPYLGVAEAEKIGGTGAMGTSALGEPIISNDRRDRNRRPRLGAGCRLRKKKGGQLGKRMPNASASTINGLGFSPLSNSVSEFFEVSVKFAGRELFGTGSIVEFRFRHLKLRGLHDSEFGSLLKATVVA